MPYKYQNNQLCLIQGTQKHNLLSLVRKTGSPVYIYDREGLMERLRFFQKSVAPALIYYAMKANSHPELLKAFCEEGVGVDIVSGGELDLALQAGFEGQKIVFSGVGKTEEEIRQAIKADILQFNVESVSELKRIEKMARLMNKKVRVAFRVNPDINLDTHSYIKTGLREHKFGLEVEQLPKLKEIIKSSPYLNLHGLTLHIGSQIHNLEPLKSGILQIKSLYDEYVQPAKPVAGQLEDNRTEQNGSTQDTDLSSALALKTFDVGGGLGIDYKSQDPTQDLKIITEYGAFLKKLSQTMRARILTEPGRIITARFGCLIGEVQYIKNNTYKNFVILNTGMHHFIRPCLYQAYHRILPLERRDGPSLAYDVVGPICESSDVLGKDRVFSGLKEGDFMAVLDTGAYGVVMASHYNAHKLPKELFF